MEVIMNSKNIDYFNKHTDFLSLRDLSDSTLKTYSSYLTQFLEWFETACPGKDVHNISWEVLRSYIFYLKTARKLKGNTINVHIATTADFFRHTLHRDWDKAQIPHQRFDTKLPNVPSRQEVNAIIDSCKNKKHRAELSLLYSSGIRVNELTRLHFCDILRTKKCIYIDKGKNRSARYAVLSEKVIRDLEAYYYYEYRTAKPSDWVFPGQKGDHICTESIRKVFAHQLESLGLSDKGYTLHSLRHAFGLHLYESGADLMSIKEAMGHKCLSSTTIYLTLGVGNGRTVTSPYDFKD